MHLVLLHRNSFALHCRPGAMRHVTSVCKQSKQNTFIIENKCYKQNVYIYIYIKQCLVITNKYSECKINRGALQKKQQQPEVIESNKQTKHQINVHL